MRIDDYFKALEKHNWSYMYSASQTEFLSGSRSEDLLVSLSALSPAHKSLYDAFHAHHYGNAKAPSLPVGEAVLGTSGT